MSEIKTIEQFKNSEIGIYQNIPFLDYSELRAVNASTLKIMERSPLHFRYAFLNPRKDTDSLSLGRTTHTAIFEPDELKRFAVMPKFDGRTTIGKEGKAKWISENEGKEFVEQDEFDTALELKEAVYSHATAKKILETKSYHELTIVWNDPATGILCKGRIDRYTEFVTGDKREPVVIDLKTCQDAREKQFAKDIFKYKYYFSLCFYMRGLQTLLGTSHSSAIIIAVETPLPHGVLVHKLQNGWLYNGFQEIDAHLKLFKECTDKNEWDGYTEKIVPSFPTNFMFEND